MSQRTYQETGEEIKPANFKELGFRKPIQEPMSYATKTRSKV